MPHDHAHPGHHHHHHHIDPADGDLKIGAAIGVNMLLTLAQIGQHILPDRRAAGCHADGDALFDTDLVRDRLGLRTVQ